LSPGRKWVPAQFNSFAYDNSEQRQQKEQGSDMDEFDEVKAEGDMHYDFCPFDPYNKLMFVDYLYFLKLQLY
jgi:hypothetical protein